MLEVLSAAGGRVVGREALAAGAGLDGLHPRRVDAVLVRLRRALPDGALVTVRGRGWALAGSYDVHRIGTSRKRSGPRQETPAP